MPSRSADPRRCLIDIRHNIHLARRFVEGQTHETFRNDDLVFYAVVRCLEIISEASRRLREGLKARHPAIPWSNMAGAGNVYRHDYEDVRRSLVWGTVRERLPALLEVVELELVRFDCPL